MQARRFFPCHRDRRACAEQPPRRQCAIADFARLYASEFQLVPLGGLLTALLLVISAMLGLCGAMLSVRRHLVRAA